MPKGIIQTLNSNNNRIVIFIGTNGQYLKADSTTTGGMVWSTINFDDIIDGTINKAFTNILKDKVDGISSGAEVNVNADWNAVTGDAQILNKPSISGSNTGDNASNSQYNGLTTSKQDTLISGTNIKTINGSSILGNGNLTVSTSTPDVTLYKLSPTSNTTIPSNYGAYVSSFFEIISGVSLEIGVDSVFEIG